MSYFRRLADRRWTAAATGCVFLLVSCTISPRKEFIYSYETVLVGNSYTKTVGNWPDSKEVVSSTPMGTKEVVSSTPMGTKVVKVKTSKLCNLFYEVENDIITRAWDDGGKDCWKVN